MEYNSVQLFARDEGYSSRALTRGCESRFRSGWDRMRARRYILEQKLPFVICDGSPDFQWDGIRDSDRDVRVGKRVAGWGQDASGNPRGFGSGRHLESGHTAQGYADQQNPTFHVLKCIETLADQQSYVVVGSLLGARPFGASAAHPGSDGNVALEAARIRGAPEGTGAAGSIKIHHAAARLRSRPRTRARQNDRLRFARSARGCRSSP